MQTKKFARIINKPVSVWKRMDAHTIEWRLCVGSFARSFVSFFLSRNGVRDAWLYLNRDLNQRWLRTIYCCVMSLFPSLARSFSLSLSFAPYRLSLLAFQLPSRFRTWFLRTPNRQHSSAMSEFDASSLSLSMKHDPHDSVTIFSRTT